ncbi:MAG TPA: hypothetical protein VIM11_17290 [Tepidisphaeraceae bacterium]
MGNPQMRPASDDLAPDTARVYDRGDPQKESGMGRLDNNVSTPAKSPDRMEEAVKHRQPLRQINADDVINANEEGQADGERIRSEEPRPDGADIENE